MSLTEKLLEGFDDHCRLFQPLLMRILPQRFRKVSGEAKLFPHCTATSIGLPVFRILGFLYFRISVFMIFLSH